MDIAHYDLKPNALLMWHYLKDEATKGLIEHKINHAEIDRRTGISKHRQLKGLNELERKRLIMDIPQPEDTRFRVVKINEIKLS